MPLSLSSAPAVEPISVTGVKDHSRISITADDALLATYITAARQYVETRLSTALITQTWILYRDYFPGSEFRLPRAPLQSVTSIKYTDEDGTESTYDSSNYQVDAVSKPGRVALASSASWPSVTLREMNGFYVTYVAGYGSGPSNVPGPIKQALFLLVADMYEFRENSIVEQGVTIEQLPFGIRSLLSSYNMRDNRCLL